MPWEDPVVTEVRRIRDEYAARFANDLDAMFDDIRRREAESGRVVLAPPAPSPPVKADQKVA
jgi:hypothetical protein